MQTIRWSNLLEFTITAVLMIWVNASQVEAQNWQVVPGRSVGPIEQNTSEVELIKIFGKQNVKRMAIDVGEGETQPGTVVFPNDPQKRALILWRDATTRLRPESVKVDSTKTLWKTDRGITIGTQLATIEELNGRAFAMTGFAWDYEGTVLHANGGRITELGSASDEEITGRMLLLRLAPSAALRNSPEYKKVMGDGRFLSDDPSMKKLNPSVYEMVFYFPD